MAIKKTATKQTTAKKSSAPKVVRSEQLQLRGVERAVERALVSKPVKKAVETALKQGVTVANVKKSIAKGARETQVSGQFRAIQASASKSKVAAKKTSATRGPGTGF